jgi:dipeptidyl aminopeptidase/acylaminoacyl peptidase
MPGATRGPAPNLGRTARLPFVLPSSCALILALCLGPLAAGAAERAGAPLDAHDIALLRSIGSLAVSPDGKHLAHVLNVPRRPKEDEDGPAWAELHVVGPDGETRPYVAGEVSVGEIAWRPEAGAISFLAKRPGDDQRSLWAIPVDGGEAQRLVTHETDITGYSWSPDGQQVAFLAREAVPERVEELAAKGFNQKVFEEEQRPVQVWIASPGDETEARHLELPGSASELHWSPSGDRLAVALAPTPSIDDHYMSRRVHLVAPSDGRVLARIDNPGKMGQIAWSPDGQHLAMISAAHINDPLEGRLKVVAAEGGSLIDILPGYQGHLQRIAWLDAETVAFIGAEGVWTTLGRISREVHRLQDLGVAQGPIWTHLSVSRDGHVLGLAGSTPEHPTEAFFLDLRAEGPAPRRVTHSNLWLAQRRLAQQEVVTYSARDGLELEGLLMRPVDGATGAAPLVIMAHGGPEAHYSNGWLTTYSVPGQALAGKGVAVFYPNYRGSTGRGVEFSRLGYGDPAGAEFDDLVDAVDHLVEIGLADTDKVGITGGSYGGYATAWASTYYSERFAAGVMFVGISNPLSKSGTSDIPQEMYHVHFGYWPWERYHFLLERSPIFHVEKARTPLLIATGEDDIRVHPSQSMQLYRFLKVLDRAPVRLVLYPGEGHGNRRASSRLDYSLRLIRWMEHYLQGPGGDPPDHTLDYSRAAAARE